MSCTTTNLPDVEHRAAWPPAPAGRNTNRLWLLACAALVVCGWGGNQFTPLLTLYRSADGWTATTVDGLLAAYVFGIAPALILGSRVSDRKGRRPVVLAALGTSAAGSAFLSTGALAELAVGRLLSGVGVGLAMAVGTSWATELTVADGGTPARGARRAALSLTAGFGIGAGVAGLLAQWAPDPETLPYLIHVGLALAALAVVAVRTAGAGSTSSGWSTTSAKVEDLLHPDVRRRRLRVLILPLAPWVFGSAGVAYAVLPQAMAHHVGHFDLLYATAITVVSLTCGILVQPIARRLDHPITPRAMRAAMALVVAGIALAAAAVSLGNPVVAAGAALILGAAYGIGVISGLLEIQRIARPDELATLTGAYYALTYIGFLFPAVLAFGARWVHPATELGGLAVVAAACGAVIAWHRPLRRSL